MKRRILSDQKRKALRRVLIAAAALVLINHFLMIGLLFPFQALRRCEERAGTGRTSVVCRERAKEIGWSCLIYLTGNENATMLSNISLGPLGWGEGEGLVLDCSGDAPLHGGWWSASREERFVLYVFGRVDDADIARLEVRLQYKDWDAGGERRTALTWMSSREDWMEKEGRRYFLFRTYPPFDWSGYRSAFYLVAIGYDAGGEEIAYVELEQGASSSYS